MRNKKLAGLMIFMAFGFSKSAFSTTSGTGLYMGLQAGMSKVYAESQTFNNCPGGIPLALCRRTVSPSTTGGAGRVFLGYNFNENFALEGGYAYFSPATYNIQVCPGSGNCGNPQIRIKGFDFFAKGMFGGWCGFDFFGKAGFGVLRSSSSGSLNNERDATGAIISCGTPGTICSSSNTTTKIQAALAAGISYNITDNWVTDLTFSRYFKSGNNNPQVDFVALGIAYHFVDRYCGQFLC